MTASMTVPICDECWRKQKGERVPVRIKEPDQEICHACGKETFSGIYVRKNEHTG
jgi:superfamily II helicase